jgi:hypothetical protein
MVPNRRWNRGRARVLSPAFDLFGATGADMDTKEQPAMPLKEQGNRNSRCGARIGGMVAAEAVSPSAASTKD